MSVATQQTFALSSQQHRRWHAAHASGRRAVLTLAIPPSLDRAKLGDALGRVVAQHEILRTRFRRDERSGMAVQVVTPPAARTWQRPCGQPDVLEAWFDREDEPRMTISISPLAADAATLDRLAGALRATLYGSGEEAEIVQYADYAGWQAQQHACATAAPAASEQRWQPWPPIAGRSSHSCRVAAEVPLDVRVERWSRSFGYSADEVLLAAWAAFLWRLNPCAPVPVAVLVPGRSAPELDSAMGPYDDHQLARIPPAQSFAQLLPAVRNARTTMATLERETAAAFTARKAPPAVAPLRIVDRYLMACHATVELDCVEHDDGWRAGLLFEQSCCSEKSADQLVHAYGRWLTTLLNDADAPLDALTFGVTPAWGDVSVDISTTPRARLVPDAFAAMARSHSFEMAVVDQREAITYADVDGRASHVARRLLAGGAAPGVTRVAVATARNANAVIGALAALKAGLSYVPIDPTWPVARQREVVALVGCEIALSDNDEPLVDLPTLRFDSEVAESFTVDIEPAWIAYIVLTSGSTGTPRAVPICHGALASYLHALGDELAVGTDDGYLHTAAISFSASLRQLLLPLVTGGRVVMASRAALLDPAMLLALTRKNGVTIVDLVPSLWWRVVRLGQPIEGLRLALSASAPLPASLAKRIRALMSNGSLIDMYGISEAAGIVTTRPVVSDVADGQLGAPLGDVVAIVVDRALRQVLPGGVGSLFVTRPGLGPAYLDGDLQATFHTLPGDGRPFVAVATGDVARVDGVGAIHLLGRDDGQVKIRGHRVQLRELERCLERHPKVEQVVALPVSSAGPSAGETSIAAHVALHPGQLATVGELLAYIDTKLPAYFRPGRLIVHDALPLGAHGKVDRRALTVTTGATPDEPRSTTETQLSKLWQQLLNRDDIHLDDDFFALGGDSLRAIDLLLAVTEEFEVSLPWQILFEAPTLAELAACIDERRQ